MDISVDSYTFSDVLPESKRFYKTKGVLQTAFDVVIVADSTDFVGEEDWALEQTVIKNAMSIFEIRPCYTRILGVVRYGSVAAITKPLVDIKKSNNYNAEKHLDEIGLLGGETANLAAGLEAAAGLFHDCYDRPDVLNVAIVITSSNNCSEEVLRCASKKLKEVAFVVTYALDVGRNIQQFEVDIVASYKEAQMHYVEYNRAVSFFRDLSNITKDCGYTDCKQCPDHYIPGELKHPDSTFMSKVTAQPDFLDQSYLRGGAGHIVLNKTDVITIFKPDNLTKVVSHMALKLEGLTYFKFYKICMTTLNAANITIGDMAKRKPNYTINIPDDLTQYWSLNCVTASTYYNWRKLKISFEVPDDSLYGPHEFIQLKDLYMEGCYSTKKVPFIKEMKRNKKRS